MRGVQAAGVALCYGNNNGGACAARERSPPGTKRGTELTPAFQLPGQAFRLNPPSPLSSIHSFAFSFSLHLSSFLHSFFLSTAVSPIYFSPSLSSQFHPFFAPTKTSIHPWHLKSNKTSSENAKPAQKCHGSQDFCLKIGSRSPRQSYFVFLVH